MRDAHIDVKVIPVMVNGRLIGSVVVTNGQSHHVIGRPNMKPYFPAEWTHDGMGGAVASWNGIALSVTPGKEALDCTLVGTVRGMHYDVRFRAATPEDAGRRFREVVL